MGFKDCVSIEGWDVLHISVSPRRFDCINFDLIELLSEIVCIAAVAAVAMELVLSTMTTLVFPGDVEVVDCDLLLLLVVNTVAAASVLFRVDGLF